MMNGYLKGMGSLYHVYDCVLIYNVLLDRMTESSTFEIVKWVVYSQFGTS